MRALDNSEPMRLLGLTSPKIGILLFEDVAANIFIQALLKRSLKLSAESFYYHKSGSDGELLKDLQRFPHKLENFSVIGIFDGDAKGKYEKNLQGKKNYIFLPESSAPEEFLINFLTNADVVEVGANFSISPATFSDAKYAVAGSDHHDYFHNLAKHLGRNFNDILSRTCEMWISANEKLTLQFLEELEKKALLE